MSSYFTAVSFMYISRLDQRVTHFFLKKFRAVIKLCLTEYFKGLLLRLKSLYLTGKLRRLEAIFDDNN